MGQVPGIVSTMRFILSGAQQSAFPSNKTGLSIFCSSWQVIVISSGTKNNSRIQALKDSESLGFDTEGTVGLKGSDTMPCIEPMEKINMHKRL